MKLSKARERGSYYAAAARDALAAGLLGEARAVNDECSLYIGSEEECYDCGAPRAAHRMFRLAGAEMLAHPKWMMVFCDADGEIGALKEYIPDDEFAEKYEVFGWELR